MSRTRTRSYESFWGGVRGMWWALRECDDRDHMECRHARHPVAADDYELSEPGPGGIQFRRYPKACRTCGDTIVHRPRREVALKLAKGRMKAALWPRKVQISRAGELATRWTWMWRGHRLFTRPIRTSGSHVGEGGR